MTSAPIVAHRPSLSGGRKVTVHSGGRDEILGTAYSDQDLVVFNHRQLSFDNYARRATK
ncbi:hypothetical protein [Streptomyces sp. NPDC006334]|uniref:hypothetical protein n=1 Tax=Streptomyces sp. NPDC006334 TaxID=3156754 RepID=UPI0033A2D93A